MVPYATSLREKQVQDRTGILKKQFRLGKWLCSDSPPVRGDRIVQSDSDSSSGNPDLKSPTHGRFTPLQLW